MKALAVRIVAEAVTRSSRVLALCGVGLLSMSCTDAPEQSSREDFSNSALVVPVVRPPTQSRAINSDNLVLEVLVNGEEILRRESPDPVTTATHRVDFGSSFVLTINWYEQYESSELQLASLTMPFSSLGATQRIEIDASEYETSPFDDDRDGASNLSEREAGSDPRDATSPANETYGFIEPDTFSLDFEMPPWVVSTGDIDGVNGDDIVWAVTRMGARGKFAVALSNGDGTFQQPLVRGEHVEANDVTGEFLDLVVTDIDADGRDDIVLNARRSTALSDSSPTYPNIAYVAFYKGDTESDFVYSRPQNLHPGGRWSSFEIHEANMDDRRGGDLLWTNVLINPNVNSTYIAYAVDTTAAGFDLETSELFELVGPLDEPASVRGPPFGYDYVHVADFNGDSRDDIMWHDLDENGNEFRVAFGTGSAPHLEFRPPTDFGGNWDLYTSLAGDANGDNRADLIEPRSRTTFDLFGIYTGRGQPVGLGRPESIIDPHVFHNHDSDQEDSAIRELFDINTLAESGDAAQLTVSRPDMHLADVDGNGTEDLLINDKGGLNSQINNIGVGLGIRGDDPRFEFNRPAQTVPGSESWSAYTTMIADVNGDGREDLLWISTADPVRVYVGLARAF